MYEKSPKKKKTKKNTAGGRGTAGLHRIVQNKYIERVIMPFRGQNKNSYAAEQCALGFCAIFLLISKTRMYEAAAEQVCRALTTLQNHYVLTALLSRGSLQR